MEKINLCFCIDDNYVFQLGAVINSLIDSNSHNEVAIYIIESGVTEASKDKILYLINDIELFSITFVPAVDDLSALKAGGHISSATYIRFSIPDILNRVNKIIYLDADLIITDDLLGLWQIELNDNYIAAVENPLFNRYKSLGMEVDWGYFNAGVMLMNLSKWRSDNIKNKALEFMAANKEVAIMFDQDALNSIMKGKWKSVPIRWNLQTIFFRRRKSLVLRHRDLNEAMLNPAIVHYSSSSKPWQLLDPHPLRYLYLDCENKFQRVPRVYKNFLRSFLRYCYVSLIYKLQKM